MTLSDYLSITEAAEESGYSKSNLRHLIYSGKIAARKIGSMWFIEKASLAGYIKRGKARMDGKPDDRAGPREQ